ncbi:MAG: Ig-like domain-containing protein [Spirochaetaceae bacterium]|jgi:hypothetical protein|nr:Ig-like domain-containing protein [Spirochaetaceae bacterium]
METKKLLIALGCLAALALAAFGIFSACENPENAAGSSPSDPFADEEYGEDWEWPELAELTLNHTTLTLASGDEETLVAMIDGESAEAWWTSNKPATVSVEDGKVTALGQGTARIKATAKTSGQTAECAVTVKVAAAGLYRNDEALPKNLTDTAGTTILDKAFAWIKANNDTEGTEYTIVLNKDIDVATGFNIGTGAGASSSTGNDANDKGLTVTLLGLDETRTVTKTDTGALFTVYGSTDDSDIPHLILGENITLKGYSSNNKALVAVGDTSTSKLGKLTMKDGSRITGNTTSATTGGGVYVATGLFNMEGGTIDANASTPSGGHGGGVNFNGGSFLMTGGLIENNVAGNTSNSSNAFGGGVYVGANPAGTLTMSGGIIRENRALAPGTSNSQGGGVYAKYFTMDGGSVLQNTAVIGGGISIAASGTFSVTDGVIAGNTASKKGAAFMLYSNGTFEKTGGVIFGTMAAGENANWSGSEGINVHSIEIANSLKAYYDDTHDAAMGTLSIIITSSIAGSVGQWSIIP